MCWYKNGGDNPVIIIYIYNSYLCLLLLSSRLDTHLSGQLDSTFPSGACKCRPPIIQMLITIKIVLPKPTRVPQILGFQSECNRIPYR